MKLTYEQIKPFCGTDESRTALTEPFIEDSKTIATNGRILIVADGTLDGWTRDPDLPPPPKAAVVLKDNWEVNGDSVWEKAPDVRVEMKVCQECDGTGDHECACGHQHQCQNCEGKGQIPDTKAATVIGCRKLANHYLALIAKLPGAEVCLTGDKFKAMPFRFDGGIGLLMPLRED